MKRRILATLLSLSMLLSLMPSWALADETTDPTGGSAACEHGHDAGECTQCGESDPNYGVPPAEEPSGNGTSGDQPEAAGDTTPLGLEDPVVQVGDETELRDAITTGTAAEIVLANDITASATFESVRNDNYTLKLNGHKITSSADQVFKNNGAGTVTIDGSVSGSAMENTQVVTEQKKDSDGKGMVVWARRGSVIINGGTYTNNSCWEATIYTGTTYDILKTTNKVVTINAGTFQNISTLQYQDKGYGAIALNVYNGNAGGQDIVVYGGTFRSGLSPALGDDARGGTFLASGYSCIQNSDGTYTVIKNPVQVGSETYATLADAIEHATTGETIELLADVNLTEQVEVAGKEITLNLNGKTVKYTGTNTLDSGVLLVHNGAGLTVTGNGTVDGNSKAYAAIALTKKGDDASKPAKLTIENGTFKGDYYAIVGNGSRPNTEITINGGSFMGTYNEDNHAIYHPQNGTLTIRGGTLKGYSTAIELRAGTLNITGGTFKSTASEYKCDPNGSGTTTIGAAIAIAQHTTKKDIAVNISGGTFTGVKALNESNPQNNDPAPQVTMNVTGGTFNGEISVTDTQSFISGGTFSVEPDSSYLATGKAAYKNSGKWLVTDKRVEVDSKPINAFEITAPDDVDDQVAKDAVKTAIASIKANAAALNSAQSNWDSAVNGTDLVTILRAAAAKPEANLTESTITKYMSVVAQKAQVATVGSNAQITAIYFDVKPMATADVDGVQVTTEIPSNKLIEKIKFRLPLPENFKDVQTVEVLHVDTSMGNYVVKQSGSDRYVELESNEFSLYGVKAADEIEFVAEVDNQRYVTLQEAITAAGNNGTVKLLTDILEGTTTYTIPSGQKVYVDLNGHHFGANNASGSAKAIAKHGNEQVRLHIKKIGDIKGNYEPGNYVELNAERLAALKVGDVIQVIPEVTGLANNYYYGASVRLNFPAARFTVIEKESLDADDLRDWTCGAGPDNTTVCGLDMLPQKNTSEEELEERYCRAAPDGKETLPALTLRVNAFAWGEDSILEKEAPIRLLTADRFGVVTEVYPTKEYVAAKLANESCANTEDITKLEATRVNKIALNGLQEMNSQETYTGSAKAYPSIPRDANNSNYGYFENKLYPNQAVVNESWYKEEGRTGTALNDTTDPRTDAGVRYGKFEITTNKRTIYYWAGTENESNHYVLQPTFEITTANNNWVTEPTVSATMKYDGTTTIEDVKGENGELTFSPGVVTFGNPPTVTYYQDNGVGDSHVRGELVASAPSAVGKYMAVFTVDAERRISTYDPGEKNYDLVEEKTLYFTIDEGQIVFNTVEMNSDQTYAPTAYPFLLGNDGAIHVTQPYPGATVTYWVSTGNVENTTNAPDGATQWTTAPKGHDAGTYHVWYQIEANSYKTVGPKYAGSMTIKKADIKPSDYAAPKLEFKEKEYDNQDYALVTPGSVNLTGPVMKYQVKQDLLMYDNDGASFGEATTVAPTGAPTGKHAGKYEVQFMIEGGNNYNDVTWTDVTYTDNTTTVAEITQKAVVLSSAVAANNPQYEKDGVDLLATLATVTRPTDEEGGDSYVYYVVEEGDKSADSTTTAPTSSDTPTTEEPKARKVGTFTVWYQGRSTNKDYKDSEWKYVVVNVEGKLISTLEELDLTAPTLVDTLTYDGTPQDLLTNAVVEGLADLKLAIQYEVTVVDTAFTGENGVTDYTDNNTMPQKQNVGTYSVAYKLVPLDNDCNYTITEGTHPITNGSVENKVTTVEIQKADLVITYATMHGPQTYTGNPLPLLAENTAVKVSGKNDADTDNIQVKYGLRLENTQGGIEDLGENAQYTNAGTYNVFYKITFLDDDVAKNYNTGTLATTWRSVTDAQTPNVATINKASFDKLPASAFTAPTANGSKPYDGSPYTLMTAGMPYVLKPDGTKTKEVEGLTFKYGAVFNDPTAPEAADLQSGIPTGTDAGTYYTYYQIVGCKNYEDSDVMATTIPTVVIDKAAPNIVVNGARDLTYNHGNPVKLLAETPYTWRGTLPEPDGFNVTYSLTEGGTYSEANSITKINAGTYTVYWKTSGTTNYEASNGSIEVGVAKYALKNGVDYELPEGKNNLKYNSVPQELLSSINLMKSHLDPEKVNILFENENEAGGSVYTHVMPKDVGSADGVTVPVEWKVEITDKSNYEFASGATHNGTVYATFEKIPYYIYTNHNYVPGYKMTYVFTNEGSVQFTCCGKRMYDIAGMGYAAVLNDNGDTVEEVVKSGTAGSIAFTHVYGMLWRLDDTNSGGGNNELEYEKEKVIQITNAGTAGTVRTEGMGVNDVNGNDSIELADAIAALIAYNGGYSKVPTALNSGNRDVDTYAHVLFRADVTRDGRVDVNHDAAQAKTAYWTRNPDVEIYD